MAGTIEQAGELFAAAGWVAWPLAAVSVVSVALCIERAFYFASVRRGMSQSRVAQIAAALRSSNESALARESGSGLLGRFVSAMLEGSAGAKIGESTVLAAAERVRPSLERYLSFLSTVITAAPMLGILGTVLGIIDSFEVLGDPSATRDPALVGQGIAEALLTTAAGLAVTLITLFPYMAIRAQVNSTLSRLETLVAAAMSQAKPQAMADGERRREA